MFLAVGQNNSGNKIPFLDEIISTISQSFRDCCQFRGCQNSFLLKEDHYFFGRQQAINHFLKFKSFMSNSHFAVSVALMWHRIGVVQVNLCQKHLFLYQLTHNMTTDSSLNYKLSTWKAQNMLFTQIVFFFCFDIHNNLWTQHVLSLELLCTELVIQWTIFCHIMG